MDKCIKNMESGLREQIARINSAIESLLRQDSAADSQIEYDALVAERINAIRTLENFHQFRTQNGM